MDGHHHMPPHGHESSSYQNGYNAVNEFGNILSNGGENDNFANWGFDAASHLPNQNAPQADPYLSWQSNTGLDNYNPQAFTKSPSNLQTTPYNGYGDNSHQYSHSAYDPSLVSANGPSPYELGPSPYGQPQQVQHGTIAPQALEHERAHAVRPSQTLDPSSYSRPSNTDPAAYNRAIPPAPIADQTALHNAIPAGTRTGNLWMKDAARLSEATTSTPVNSFIFVGNNELELPINRATVAHVARRKSRAELRRLAGNDPKLQEKLRKKERKPTALPTGPGSVGRPTQAVKQEHSDSETDSSDYDSDDESDEEPEVSPLAAQRSDDPREGVKYDTIKALWESRHTSVVADRIRTGMVEFNEVVQTVKNRWKADSLALTDAIDRKRNGELPLLRSRVNDQLEMLKIALQTAMEHGNRDIMAQLGQHAQIMASFAQFLIDRIKKNDYDGPLTRLILEVLMRCETFPARTYEVTKLGKCISNLSKNGNKDTHDLCERIKSNVTGGADNQASNDQQPGVKSPPSNRPTPEPVAGIKRAAPGSASSDQASKRVLVAPTTGNAAAKTSTLKRVLPVGSNPKPAAAAAKPVVGATVKAKPAVTKSVISASTGAGIKKAVTKTATPSVVAAAIKSIEKKAAPAAPAKPAFSFAETMANLNKSKEKEPSPLKTEEKQTPETPEERAKRLRKEERRKLRVTFKPDSQLVETRIFHHDAEEELGHDASMIRDVSDVGGEGRMFKQHKDMMDIDEDDDTAAGEENLGEHVMPTLTDFSSVDAEERKRNYNRYAGGELQPESAERTKREQYEASTLMVFYTDPSDIPPSPREPADPYNGEEVTTKAFGALGTQEPLASRIAKLAGPDQPAQTQQSSAAPDISAILALINPQGQAPSQPSQPAQPVSAPASAPASGQNQDQMAEIQRILASIPQAASQQQQPQQMHVQQPVQQPPQPSMAPDLAGIFANLNPLAQAPNIFASTQQQQPVMDASPAAFAALFSQLNPGQNGGPGANFNQFPYPGAGFNMPNMGQFPGQQQNQQPPFENEERRRWREGGGDNNNNDHMRRGKPGKKGTPFTDKRFTVPCKYFKKGQCQKGDSCTYRHEY
ncbi:hypothetical protein E4T48_03350 [Aureobasidium sp. EXF-10727]|nr:hypothetical protein E4T48_03350 [Aureobasidium sp. EXF-10727]